MSIFFLPTLHPSEYKLRGEGFTLTNIRKITVSRTGDAAVNLLKERFPEAEIEEIPEGFTLSLTDGTLPTGFPSVPKGNDAYAINVGSNGIRAAAGTAAGLFYAVSAVCHFPNDIPGMELEDRAAIPLRMLHWDLKGYLPRFEVLCDELRILAAYKVNAILLEIEDKYAYASVPGIAVEGAYTYEEMRQLSHLAASLHIRIVPKLQSIAHVDYILKHQQYASLRENGHVFQYCATNPEVRTLWEKMAGELMEVFREHATGGLFHIGADEPGNLGECPECRKLGAAGSYKYRIKACIDFVNVNGWKPVMWDDIVRNHPAEENGESLRSALGKDAVLMYWAYGYGGRNNGLEYLKPYLSEGLKIYGASGYAGCDNWAGSVPPMEYRALNIDAWTRAAVENGLESVCATGWTRIGSADCPAEPQESCWFTALYAAVSMWTGLAFPYPEFCRELFSEFYGSEPEEDLLAAVINIGKSSYDYQRAIAASPDEAADRLSFLRYAAALECLASTRNRILNYFQYYDGKLGTAMEDYRLGMLKGFSEQFQNDLLNWKEKTRSVYSVYYKPVTVEEILRTRFGYLEKLTVTLKKLLDETVEI